MLELAIAAARLLESTGAALLFGAPLLLLTASTAAGSAGWTRPLAFAAAALTATGSLLALGLQTVGMAGSVREGLSPGALGDVVASTGFGRSVGVRLLAAAVAASLAPRLASRSARIAAAAAGAVALASLAWSGHGAADEGARGWMHLSADVVHLLAAGAWLGALAALLALELNAGRSAGGRAALTLALQRFSGVGGAVVALLLLSGLVNAWMLVGPQHWRSLTDDPYGRLLLFKLLAFATMLGLAAANRYALTPRLAAVRDGDAAARLRALRTSVGAEAALGLAVLAAVAIMGGLVPPEART